MNPLYESDGDEPAGPTQELIVKTFQCTNCHVFDDSSKASYGPNLTHLASRSTLRQRHLPAEPREPDQLGEGRTLDDPDVVAGLPAPTG